MSNKKVLNHLTLNFSEQKRKIWKESEIKNQQFNLHLLAPDQIVRVRTRARARICTNDVMFFEWTNEDEYIDGGEWESGRAKQRKVNISSGLLWLFRCALKNKAEKKKRQNERPHKTNAEREHFHGKFFSLSPLLSSLSCFSFFHTFLHSFVHARTQSQSQSQSQSQTHSHPPTHSCIPSLWIYPLVSLLFWLETSPLHYYLTTNTEQFAKLINGLLFCNTDECFAVFFSFRIVATAYAAQRPFQYT